MNPKKTAVFAGSFDPVTLGHENVIERALPLFDEIIVAIGVNADKPSGMFNAEQRRAMIEARFAGEPKVRVEVYSGLTVDFCRAVGAKFLLRGLRSEADFEYERIAAHSNKTLAPEIETVFMLTDPAYSHICSSVVRDILGHGGDVSGFVSEPVLKVARASARALMNGL